MKIQHPRGSWEAIYNGERVPVANSKDWDVKARLLTVYTKKPSDGITTVAIRNSKAPKGAPMKPAEWVGVFRCDPIGPSVPFNNIFATPVRILKRI